MKSFFATTKLFAGCALFMLLFVAGMCTKEDPVPDNDSTINEPSLSFTYGSGFSWKATTIARTEKGTSWTNFRFENSGAYLYSDGLKDRFPQLTERLRILLFSAHLTVGTYRLKYGPGTQGIAEFDILQSADAGAQKADSSLITFDALGVSDYESSLTVTKIENNRMSGTFHLWMIRNATGHIPEFKNGIFENIPVQ